jgi:hypothetical protein
MRVWASRSGSVFNRRAEKSAPKADAATKAPGQNETVALGQRLGGRSQREREAQEACARGQTFLSGFRAVAARIDLEGVFERAAHSAIARGGLRHHRHRRRRVSHLPSGAPLDVRPEPLAPPMERRVRGCSVPAEIAPHHLPERARLQRMARHRVADHPEAVALARQYITREKARAVLAARTSANGQRPPSTLHRRKTRTRPR